MFKLVLEKAEEPEIKLPTSAGSWKKQESSRKNIYFCFVDYAKAFVWVTVNCGKFWKRWEYQSTLPASWEICMQGKKQQLEMDMEQRTVSRLGKEYVKAVYCHPAYLTSMQSSVQFSSAAQSCPTLCNPMDCSPSGSSVHGDSPDKNTGVRCHALLQGIFPT